MHDIATIKFLNTKAAVAGVSRRAKSLRATKSTILDADDRSDLEFETTADSALGGDITAWDAMVAELARREAQ